MIERVSPTARNYLEGIPSNQWRRTAWLDDPGLPHRYGILTSNMSESANNMFEKARDVSWLNTIDIILGMMMERIAMKRKNVNLFSLVIKESPRLRWCYSEVGILRW